MDRCPKIEFSRLFGELSWHGFNSKISSKRRSKGIAEQSRHSNSAETITATPGFETKAIHSGASPTLLQELVQRQFIKQLHTFLMTLIMQPHFSTCKLLEIFTHDYQTLPQLFWKRRYPLENGRGATCMLQGTQPNFLHFYLSWTPEHIDCLHKIIWRLDYPIWENV